MIAFTLNGRTTTVEADPGTPLLWVLRDQLQLTGTKSGCGIAQCGACTVHLDGRAVRSCVTPVSMVSGKRVTTKETVEVVEMVLSGLVNKRIVQAINDAGGRAIGISGKDDDLMVCEPDDPELGFVGRPVEMNIQIIRDLYLAGLIPVIAPVATGMEDNETFNVNGDTAAGAIAGALKADRLLLLTDVSGVKDASGEVLTAMTPDQVRQMIADGTIAGGMIPKTETALKALEDGVRAVVILDGRVPNATLLELFTEHGAGSLIRSTEPRVKPRGLRQGDSGL